MFSLLYLSDIPDEEKNGDANDYNDDYEDDFNPTRYIVFNCNLLVTLYFVFVFSRLFHILTYKTRK